jgi:SAM-dependent methyltransferase
MTQLYTTYAELYHKMYQSLIDYDEEYNYYRNLIDEQGGRDILEIGCGTGQLARRFLENGYGYTGIDVSEEMLKYAASEVPSGHFHQMDMRDMRLPTQFDTVIITARSISYILTNEDLMATFRSVKNVLKKGGFLIFDFIDAMHFIPAIQEGETITHEVVLGNEKYKRESVFEKRISENWRWIWKSTFWKEEKRGYQEIGSDEAELRSFTKDELEIFLILSKLDVTAVLERKVYAFNTRVVVARN